MESLLNVLKELYNTTDNSYVCEEDGNTYFKRNDVVCEAEGLCGKNLITSDGRCNWESIEVLTNNGYCVSACDRDSFGWLTYKIQKIGDPRILVYG